MQQNLMSSHGLFFSQKLLLALVESGLTRDDAYRLTQRNAMRAWDEGTQFEALVRGDTEVTSRLDEARLAQVFDIRSYTRHIDTVFERLEALAAGRGEHAHG
jgi:adenylosuccinate lyase